MFCVSCTVLRKTWNPLNIRLRQLFLQVCAVADLPIKMGLLLASKYVACSDLRIKIKCLFLLALSDPTAWMNFLLGLQGIFFDGGCVVWLIFLKVTRHLPVVRAECQWVRGCSPMFLQLFLCSVTPVFFSSMYVALWFFGAQHEDKNITKQVWDWTIEHFYTSWI